MVAFMICGGHAACSFISMRVGDRLVCLGGIFCLDYIRFCLVLLSVII